MALSNSTLSGCFDPISARGFTAFLLVQATVSARSTLNTAIKETRRDIKIWPSKFLQITLCGDIRPRLSEQRSSVFSSGAVSNFQQRRFGRRLQQRPSIFSWIAVAEHGVARHQNFRPRPHHIAHGSERHAAIYFDAVVQPALSANLGQLAHFVQRRRQELLGPKA